MAIGGANMVGFNTYADAAPSAADDRREEEWARLVADKLEELHRRLSTPEGGRRLDRDYEPDWSGVIAAVENGCVREQVCQELHKVLEPIATAMAESEWP